MERKPHDRQWKSNSRAFVFFVVVDNNIVATMITDGVPYIQMVYDAPKKRT